MMMPEDVETLATVMSLSGREGNGTGSWFNDSSRREDRASGVLVEVVIRSCGKFPPFYSIFLDFQWMVRVGNVSHNSSLTPLSPPHHHPDLPQCPLE